MSRSVELTAQSPYSVHRIHGAFGDAAYWQARLTAFEGGSPTLDGLSVEPGGETSVSMTMRFSGDQLPDPLQRLRLPSLEIVQRERWSAAGPDGLHGDITVEAPRTPMSGRGSVDLTPAGAGTRLAGLATVQVNVPIIGGPISKFIAGQLARGILDIVAVTDSWLAENPSATE